MSNKYWKIVDGEPDFTITYCIITDKKCIGTPYSDGKIYCSQCPIETKGITTEEYNDNY